MCAVVNGWLRVSHTLGSGTQPAWKRELESVAPKCSYKSTRSRCLTNLLLLSCLSLTEYKQAAGCGASATVFVRIDAALGRQILYICSPSAASMRKNWDWCLTSRNSSIELTVTSNCTNICYEISSCYLFIGEETPKVDRLPNLLTVVSSNTVQSPVWLYVLFRET